MSGVELSHPRLAWPFTIVADGEMVHLIAGEDVRYSVHADGVTAQLAEILRQCDGSRSVNSLTDGLGESERTAVRALIARLSGERILYDGPVESFLQAACYYPAAEGCGHLLDRLSQTGSAGRPLAVLCQNTLDYNAALKFNRRCLRAGDGPWMWVTTGPANRGYVSPVFLPGAGPCLNCLLRHFQRLSPAGQLYEALIQHSELGGDFIAAPFPDDALTILEQIAVWKIRQLSLSPVPAAVFRLHVLELDSLEVSLHRVFLDPTCPDCQDARLV